MLACMNVAAIKANKAKLKLRLRQRLRLRQGLNEGKENGRGRGGKGREGKGFFLRRRMDGRMAEYLVEWSMLVVIPTCWY